MTRRKARKTIRIGSGIVPIGGPEYAADYQARVKAAALDGGMDGLSMDAQRLRMARRIAMWMNAWPGCPNAICQRMRGCMAPAIHCSNVPRISKEELAARWPQTLVTVRRALDEACAAPGMDRE